MNDRFKFRVYSHEQKKMRYIDNFESGRDFYYGCFLDNRYFGEGCHTVMQSTGLKDRNKKDIYENDIVEFTHTTNIKCRGVIKFLKEDAMFVVVYKNPRSNKEDWDFMSKFTLNVIGNIYTTPGLLEAQNGKY